jgi:hypothetical protein
MMKKKSLTIEILGIISLISCVLFLAEAANDFKNPQAEMPQAVISGSLG